MHCTVSVQYICVGCMQLFACMLLLRIRTRSNVKSNGVALEDSVPCINSAPQAVAIQGLLCRGNFNSMHSYVGLIGHCACTGKS